MANNDKSNRAITYVLVTKSKREFVKLSNTLNKSINKKAIAKKPNTVWKSIAKMSAIIEDIRVYPGETSFTTIFDGLGAIMPKYKGCIIIQSMCVKLPFPPYRYCILIARDGLC